jgi:hypothetical protein
LEKSEHDAWKSTSLIHLVLSWVSITLTVLVSVLLVVDGWFAYDVFFRDDPGSPPVASSHGDEPTYSGLRIAEDQGRFAGEVTIRNPFDRDVTVLVTVNVYDGEQEVGELIGDVTLKPESESTVELTGLDDYSAYTDARVHLSGWPT